MSTVTVTQDIPVAPDRVWQALADFGNIQRFHPGLKSSRLTGDKASGVGAVRRCDLKAGGHIVERVTDWTDGKGYTIEVTETSLPLKRATTSLSVAPAGGNGARVSISMDYTPKYGPVGAILDAFMMRGAVQAQLKGIIDGLAAYARGS